MHAQPHPHPQPNPLAQTTQPHIVPPLIPENRHEYLEFSLLSSIQSSANENQPLPVHRIFNGRIV